MPYPLYLIWLPYTFVAVIFLYSFVRHFKRYEHTFKQKESHSPKIIFQLATKGGNIELVQNNVNNIISINRNINYQNFEICVVTDGTEKYYSAKTINVPANYTCRHAKHKARALQYTIDQMQKQEQNLSEIWIQHLDEESVVTKNSIIACIEFIEKNPDKLLAEGAINYPINFYKSQFLIPSLMEAERAFGCYFCCTQMEHHSPLYLHGSNLLVRADIEAEIGWDFESMAEDSCFGHMVSRRYGNVFGWTHGTILEQPAFTIRDAITQRKRWFYGTIQNLKYCTLKIKIIQLTFLSIWKTGFISGFVGIASQMGYVYVPENIKMVLIFNTIVWLFMYQWGTWLNLRHITASPLKKLATHAYCLIITPVLGFFSTMPAFLVLISKPKSFEVIKKS